MPALVASMARKRMASSVAWSSLRAPVFLLVAKTRFYESDFTFENFNEVAVLSLYVLDPFELAHRHAGVLTTALVIRCVADSVLATYLATSKLASPSPRIVMIWLSVNSDFLIALFLQNQKSLFSDGLPFREDYARSDRQ